MLLKKKQFWGSLIAIALLVFCLIDISIDEIKGLWGKVDLIYLIPSVIAAFAYIALRALRWQLIISQQKKIKWFRALTLYSAGQMINILIKSLKLPTVIN